MLDKSPREKKLFNIYKEYLKETKTIPTYILENYKKDVEKIKKQTKRK